MGKEIERKFLIKDDTWKSMVSKEVIIKQGYLNTDPNRTVRVRIKGDNGFITIKGSSKNGISRTEFEYDIPCEDAGEMLGMCDDHIIEKTRFEVPFREHLFEIDVFEGQNRGLVLAEVELKSEDQQVDLPNWIGEEVSGDKKYYNSYLSKYPFGQW